MMGAACFHYLLSILMFSEKFNSMALGQVLPSRYIYLPPLQKWQTNLHLNLKAYYINLFFFAGKTRFGYNSKHNWNTFVRKYHYIYECISNYQQMYIEQHAVCITDLEKWCWCQAQLLWQWKCQEREVCFDFCWWGFWCSLLVESESKKNIGTGTRNISLV